MSVELFEGDCREWLPTVAGRVDVAVVSDPPYGMKWKTNCGRFSGGSKHHRKAASGRDWPAPVIGDDAPFDPSPWLDFPRVILWGFNHFAARLPVGSTLVWVKRHDDAFGSFLSDAEIAWMKGGHGVYLHKDLSMNGEAKRRVHPTQKPVGLMRWCIERLKLKPGSTVFDPYMGSGTTGVAAVRLGFNFIGCEVDPSYFRVAEKRVDAALNETPLLTGA